MKKLAILFVLIFTSFTIQALTQDQISKIKESAMKHQIEYEYIKLAAEKGDAQAKHAIQLLKR